MWERIIIKLIPVLLPVLSDTLRQMIQEFVEEFEKKAKTTPNPYDDLAAELLRNILCPK